MEFARQFVQSMRTGFKEDVCVNLATIWSTTTALSVLQASSMMFTSESAEYNVEQINSTTSILGNATAPKATTSSRVSARNVSLERPTMLINKNAVS